MTHTIVYGIYCIRTFEHSKKCFLCSLRWLSRQRDLWTVYVKLTKTDLSLSATFALSRLYFPDYIYIYIKSIHYLYSFNR